MTSSANHLPDTSSRLIRAARGLFYLNAVVWLVFGLASLLRLANTDSTPSVTLLIVAVLMFGNAAAMLLSGLGLARQTLLPYLFAVAVVLVNILLTFTDQFGLFDFLTLALDILLLVVMLLVRKSFVSSAR